MFPMSNWSTITIVLGTVLIKIWCLSIGHTGSQSTAKLFPIKAKHTNFVVKYAERTTILSLSDKVNNSSLPVRELGASCLQTSVLLLS